MLRVFLLQSPVGRDATDDIAQPAGAFEDNHPLPAPQAEEQHVQEEKDFMYGLHETNRCNLAQVISSVTYAGISRLLDTKEGFPATASNDQGKCQTYAKRVVRHLDSERHFRTKKVICESRRDRSS